MKGINLANSMLGRSGSIVSRANLAPWTCRQCSAQKSKGVEVARGYGTNGRTYGKSSGSSQSGKRKNGRIILAAAGGAVGISTIAFGDDIKHAYKATERSGRVASTLAVCINE